MFITQHTKPVSRITTGSSGDLTLLVWYAVSRRMTQQKKTRQPFMLCTYE